jgi:hypothetical protein
LHHGQERTQDGLGLDSREQHIKGFIACCTVPTLERPLEPSGRKALIRPEPMKFFVTDPIRHIGAVAAIALPLQRHCTTTAAEQ